MVLFRKTVEPTHMRKTVGFINFFVSVGSYKIIILMYCPLNTGDQEWNLMDMIKTPLLSHVTCNEHI